MRCIAILALLAMPFAHAEDRVRQMTERLSEEAAAFARMAPQILARETLEQRAIKPPPRFRPRIGASAAQPAGPEYQTRTIVSEYGFSSLASSPDAVHEFREVISVDGRPVKDAGRALTNLASGLASTDDARKRRMLKTFEKYGLRGGVTDFGQLILLFDRRRIMQYEFSQLGTVVLHGDPMLLFAYRQLDGPEGVTVIDANQDNKVEHFKAQGRIWVRASDLLPERIELITLRGTGKDSVRDEATVDYTMSPYGALLPAEIQHRELQAGTLITENTFHYSLYRKFGTSTEIRFSPTAPGKR